MAQIIASSGDPNGLVKFYNQIFNAGAKNSWNAPLKLIDKLDEALAANEMAGNNPALLFDCEIPTKKPGLVPRVADWNFNKTVTVPFNTTIGENRIYSSLAPTPGNMIYWPSGTVSVDDATFTAPNDLACYLRSVMTVKEYKEKHKYVNAEVYPFATFNKTKVEWTSPPPANREVDTLFIASGIITPAHSTGSKGEDGTGTVTFTLDQTTEYDDWFVVEIGEMYGRTGKGNPRTPINGLNKAEYDYYPTVPARLSRLGCTKTKKVPQTNPIFNDAYWTADSSVLEGGGWTYLSMPYVCTFGTSWRVSRATAFVGSSLTFGTYLQNHYPNATVRMAAGGGTSAVPFQPSFVGKMTLRNTLPADCSYYYRQLGGDISAMPVAYDEGLSPDYFMQVYNAHMLGFFNNTKTTYQDTARQTTGYVGKMPVSRNENRIDSANGCFISADAFGGGSTGEQRLVFKTKEDIINFFADWGILASDDYGVITTEDNPNDDSDNPFGPGGWNPDSPGGNPWDNPGGDNTTVDYDPTNPGDDVIDKPVVGLTSATGQSGYVLDYENYKNLETWLIGESFLKDASNLFTDKMSAISGLTIYPFDIVKHDPSNTQTRNVMTIAGASTNTVQSYSILTGYNYWIHGGSIAFKEDWLPIRGDYNAFSTSSYSVFIPLIGMVEVPASAVIFRTLTLDYAVDLVSGEGTAILRSFGSGDNGYIVQLLKCQMGQPVPLFSSNTVQRQLAIVTGAVNGLTGSGAVDAGKSTNNAITSMGKMAPGAGASVGQAGAAAAGTGLATAGAVAGVGVGAVMAVGNAVKGGFEAAVSNPKEFAHKGENGAMSAWFLGFQPQLIVTSQIPATPANYEYVMGQRTSQRGYLYKFANNGLNYVECSASKISIPGATGDELSMIDEILKRGVFI